MQQTDKEDENMKKFINQVELVEDQMIQGMVKQNRQKGASLNAATWVVGPKRRKGRAR